MASASSTSEDVVGRLIISCVGDSLTFGSGVTGLKMKNSYPAVLKQQLHMRRHHIHNFGEGGMTMVKEAANRSSYWDSIKYKEAMNSHPNIVVIMLGTNDAKPQHWNQINFRKDYIEMILGFQNLKSKPTVYICIPPPVNSLVPVYKIDPNIVNNILPNMIKEIGSFCNVEVIDNFELFGGVKLGHDDAYSVDNCHLNNHGYSMIAENVGKILLTQTKTYMLQFENANKREEKKLPKSLVARKLTD